MATPLDPDRWNEFSKPVPPSPAARRERVVDRAKYATRAQSKSEPRVAQSSEALIPRRFVIAGGAGALGLVAILALFAGGASASSGEQAPEEPYVPAAAAVPTPVTSAAVEVPVSWAALLAELDLRRQRSFASADAAAVGTYAKAGSAAAARDVASMNELAAMGARAKGMTSKILTVKVVASDAVSADLEVTDELSGYHVVRSDDGAVIEARPSRPAAAWKIRLEKVQGQWLLADSRAL